MRQSTLLQIMEVLTKKDLRDLQKWLASPFFNQRKDVEALFEMILTYREKDPVKLVKKNAWTMLYPDKRYDEIQINHLMSWLLRQIRDYLTYTEWQEDAPSVKLSECRVLRKKGLDGIFARAWDEGISILEQLPFRDEHYHYTNYLIYLEKYGQQLLQSRSGDLPLSEIQGHASMAYRFNQLRFDCFNATIQTVKSPAANQAEGVESKSLENTPEELPGIRLYERLLQALKTPEDEAAFRDAKLLLATNWQLFREGERRTLYLLALNYCIRKINSGKQEYMREAFELYRDGMENRSLFENGMLSRFTYQNVVTSGLYLFEFAWVRQFLEDYKPFLPVRDRHQAYTFNLATYYFRLPDYDQVMILLRDTDFDNDALTNLNARSMLLRIYFERGNTEALNSLLESFQAYLRRHKDIGYHVDSFSNLIRFVRRMIRESPLSGSAKEKLREDIENTPSLAERRWLLKQLDIEILGY